MNQSRTDGRDETEVERVDRELIELLNELRVALPGVQVLFAFLLTVAFSNSFNDLDITDKRVYIGALLLSALAAMLFMTPTAHHRLRFRQGAKPQMVKVANGLTIAGMVCLAVSMGLVVYLVTDVTFGTTWARLLSGAIVALFALVWFAGALIYDNNGTSPPH
jgi:hypothetical protein